MPRTDSISKHAADGFFRSLSDRGVRIAGAVLTEDTVETIPFAMAGGAHPERTFQGKNAASVYLQTTLDNFTQAVMVDRHAFVTDNGSTVFVEGRGALIRNRLLNRIATFTYFASGLCDGYINEIRNYASPVCAKTLG